MNESSILLDVSRLIWRRWTNRLPTGIDRVCLAYLEHFAGHARAVVQFRKFRLTLNRANSSRLFDLLLGDKGHFRARVTAILGRAALHPGKVAKGQLYLNVGHTGLDSDFLSPWLASRGLRPIVLIHDLIPITHPQFCRQGEAERHARRISNALSSASGIIVNSRATEQDVRQFSRDNDLPMPPCIVAWLGTDRALETATPLAKPSKRPYFAMVGTIEARKNHLLILRLWAELLDRLGDQAPQLVVIGQRGWEADRAIAILDHLGPLSGHVRELARCDDATMNQLVAGAQAMLMPSFVEGFGLPLAEALARGVPVIASDLPVFREIAGSIPTFIAPDDRQQWLDTICHYSENGPERQRQLAALKAFHAPCWSDHFAKVDALLQAL